MPEKLPEVVVLTIPDKAVGRLVYGYITAALIRHARHAATDLAREGLNALAESARLINLEDMKQDPIAAYSPGSAAAIIHAMVSAEKDGYNRALAEIGRGA